MDLIHYFMAKGGGIAQSHPQIGLRRCRFTKPHNERRIRWRPSSTSSYYRSVYPIYISIYVAADYIALHSIVRRCTCRRSIIIIISSSTSSNSNSNINYNMGTRLPLPTSFGSCAGTYNGNSSEDDRLISIERKFQIGKLYILSTTYPRTHIT